MTENDGAYYDALEVLEERGVRVYDSHTLADMRPDAHRETGGEG